MPSDSRPPEASPAVAAKRRLQGLSPHGFEIIETWDYGPRICVWYGTDEGEAHKVCDELQRRETCTGVRYEIEWS